MSAGENIARDLLARFLADPTRVVMIDELGHRVTAGALAAAIQRAAAGHAVHRRVGLCADNSVALVASLLGALVAEVAVMPLHAATPPAERARIAERFQLAGLGVNVPVVAHSPAPDEDPIALLLATSGTTGAPRAVAVGHTALARHTRALATKLAFGPTDRVLATLPLAHSYGCRMALLAPLWAGATVVLLPRFSARMARARLTEQAITWVPVVPTMLAAWVHLAHAAPEPPPPALRWVLSAGAPLPGPLRAEAEAVLGAPVREGYGLTEATFAAIDTDGVAGSVGRAVPGVALRLDPETAEIQVRGQNLMQGYLDDPDATRAAFTADGWLHTGDVGRFDEGGNLFVVDRIKDILLPGGHTVYPAEVESVVAAHPAVAAVAVVGRPDAFLGEAIVACVVLRDALPESEQAALADSVRALAAAQLAPYKVPHHVVVVPELPLGPTGKVLRAALRTQVRGPRPAS